MNLLFVAIAGYLIGTMSFTRLIGRYVLPGEDLSKTEYAIPDSDETWTYHGVSASTVIEKSGWKWGLTVAVLDGLKAFIPTLALLIAYPESPAYAIAAVSVMVGHVWPAWWQFKGGRGQAVLIGAVVVIDPVAIPVAVVAGAVLGLVGFTSVYMARNMGPFLAIPWFWWQEGIGTNFWFAIAVNVVYWAASRDDIVEDLRIRRIRGVSAMAYPNRLRNAWQGFLTED
jgi:glycerol-3-phosphate acyltransferase PlsY